MMLQNKQVTSHYGNQDGVHTRLLAIVKSLLQAIQASASLSGTHECMTVQHM